MRFTLAVTVSNILTLKMLTLKIYINITEYNVRNDVIRRQISLSIKVYPHFAPALTVSEKVTFKMFDLNTFSSRSQTTTVAVTLLGGE